MNERPSHSPVQGFSRWENNAICAIVYVPGVILICHHSLTMITINRLLRPKINFCLVGKANKYTIHIEIRVSGVIKDRPNPGYLSHKTGVPAIYI